MNQVALFLLILFGITWGLGFFVALMPPPGNLQEFLVAFLPQVWAPTIISLILVRLAEGAGSVRKEITDRLSYKSGTARWLALAGILPATATCVAVFTARAAGDDAPFVSSAALPLGIGMQFITGAVGEELGWRGFLLPRLGKRFGGTTAAWVMAILWSLWHVPAWFNPWLPHRTMPMASTLFFIASFGVFLAFVFNRAGGSVLATILAHLSLNIMTALGGVHLSSVVFWRTLAGIFGVLAVLTTVVMSRSSSSVHEAVAR